MGTFLTVSWVQLAIHGNEAFEHDAGADFAVSILGCLFAVPIAMACFALVFYFLHKRARISPAGMSKAYFHKS